jgi:HSP20 family molecular chaperone IbpA
MNPFVNPNHRGVSLPAGCKDLVDLLQFPSAPTDVKTKVTEAGFTISVRLPGFRGHGVEVTAEKNALRFSVKTAPGNGPVESIIEVPDGFDLSGARASYFNGQLRVVVPPVKS